MSDISRDRLSKALALRGALVEEAETLTYEQACDELEAACQDAAEVGSALRARAFNIVAAARKARLAEAQKRLRSSASEATLIERSIATVRRALEKLATQPESLAGKRIALAHRNGKAQSDDDVLSLWQDLVDLGAASDDDLTD